MDVLRRARRTRPDPWPPPAPISPRGRAAALVTSLCLVVAGVAFVWASVDELFCRGRVLGGGNPRTALGPQSECDLISGIAGLVSFLGLVTAALGVGIWWRVRRRPVNAEGGAGWQWGEGLLAMVGIAVLATRLPSYTCPGGFRLDENFSLCIAGDARFDATAHSVEKLVITLGGLLVGLVLGRARWVPPSVAAVITLAAWFTGMGWLLVDTVGGNLVPG